MTDLEEWGLLTMAQFAQCCDWVKDATYCRSLSRLREMEEQRDALAEAAEELLHYENEQPWTAASRAAALKPLRAALDALKEAER